MSQPAGKQAASAAPKSSSGYDIAPLAQAQVAELAKSLSAEERRVLL
jgi:hypothetical protein